MTDTNKMREQFEAFIREIAGRCSHPEEYCLNREERISAYVGDPDNYERYLVREMWRAWQASRQAVFVELPPALRGLIDADDVTEIIEAQGLRVGVKP